MLKNKKTKITLFMSAVLVGVVAIFWSTSHANVTNKKMNAMIHNEQTTFERINRRFEEQHRIHDAGFFRDKVWYNASGSDANLRELNFVRWMAKHGYLQNLIKESDFNQNASSYERMIETWRKLITQGKFSASSKYNPRTDYTYKDFTKLTNLGQLQPLYYSPRLKSYTDTEVNKTNKITRNTESNRISLGIHEPSREGDQIRRASGDNAIYAENIMPGLVNWKPTLRLAIFAFLIDDDNNYANFEGGHRWNIFTHNKYAALSQVRSTGAWLMVQSDKVSVEVKERAIPSHHKIYHLVNASSAPGRIYEAYTYETQYNKKFSVNANLETVVNGVTYKLQYANKNSLNNAFNQEWKLNTIPNYQVYLSAKPVKGHHPSYYVNRTGNNQTRFSLEWNMVGTEYIKQRNLPAYYRDFYLSKFRSSSSNWSSEANYKRWRSNFDNQTYGDYKNRYKVKAKNFVSKYRLYKKYYDKYYNKFISERAGQYLYGDYFFNLGTKNIETWIKKDLKNSAYAIINSRKMKASKKAYYRNLFNQKRLYRSPNLYINWVKWFASKK